MDDLLGHRVAIVRQVTLLEGGEPVLNEDGQLQHSERRSVGVAAAIQPLSSRERAAQHQAGLAVCSHRIYTAAGVTLSPADAIEHDPETCPMNVDLPFIRFQLSGVRNAAGLGHHLEIDATEAGPSLKPAGAGGSGSGSGGGS